MKMYVLIAFIQHRKYLKDDSLAFKFYILPPKYFLANNLSFKQALGVFL